MRPTEGVLVGRGLPTHARLGRAYFIRNARCARACLACCLRRRPWGPKRRRLAERRDQLVRRLDQDRHRPDHRHDARDRGADDRRLGGRREGAEADAAAERRQGHLYAARLSHRLERKTGRQDLLHLGPDRRSRRARGARLRRRDHRQTSRQRSLERGRCRGDPEHRRQDHLANCGKHAERPLLHPCRRRRVEQRQQQHERNIPPGRHDHDHGPLPQPQALRARKPRKRRACWSSP